MWGTGTPGHISFHVKDDVDLNAFAKQLEEECQRRGIKNVVCNRIIQVKSEAERRNAALKYCANKFWNDPEYFVEGYSDSEFGDFLGWSLFYCKGPNGEQLEFNQVTRQSAGVLRQRATAIQRGQRHHLRGVALPAEPRRQALRRAPIRKEVVSDAIRNTERDGECPCRGDLEYARR